MSTNYDFFLIQVLFVLILLPNHTLGGCTFSPTVVRCEFNNESSSLNISRWYNVPYDKTEVVYNGNVTLQLIAPTTKSISIYPYSQSGANTLQISTLNTNAKTIEVSIYLSTFQLQNTLFTAPNSLVTDNASLIVNINTGNFSVENYVVFPPSTQALSLLSYEVIYDGNVNSSRTLNLASIVGNLNGVPNVIIKGSNHSLQVPRASRLQQPSLRQLSLNDLLLHEKFDDYFPNMKKLNIQGCTFNRSARFLELENTAVNLTLDMKNNKLVDMVLPNGEDAFKNTYNNYIGITIIQRDLTSSFVKKLGRSRQLRSLFLELGNYEMSDFREFAEYKPIMWELTIKNLQTLNVLPKLFYNKLEAIQKTTLEGSFALEKEAICTFYGMKVPNDVPYPIVHIYSLNGGNWDTCADTYIKGINFNSISSITCPPSTSPDPCAQWKESTARCSLTNYELNQCSGTLDTSGTRFRFANSSLARFFRECYWMTPSTSRPGQGSTNSRDNSVNIGAIVGALIGLLFAITILTITIFCVRRYRRNQPAQYLTSELDRKSLPPPYEYPHMSIATSKTSGSLYPKLSSVYFPPMNPIDEVAPPLYTPPSEAANTNPQFKYASAPPGRRDSTSTHATHVYATIEG